MIVRGSSTCSGRVSSSSSRRAPAVISPEPTNQAGEYFDALPERERPRYILVSDFQTFELHDLDEREKIEFALGDLPADVEAFGFILGVQRRTFRDQDPANIKAAELVGRLHDALAASGYRGHDLERFLVRIVFCLFGDDTGIFEPRDIFLDFIERPHERGRRRPGAVAVAAVRGSRHAGGCACCDARRGPGAVPVCERRVIRRGRCASPRSTLPCARCCSTPAISTGRTSHPPSSGRCSSRPWTQRNAAPRARTTPPRRTS